MIDYGICNALTTTMIVEYNVLSDIISGEPDILLIYMYIYNQEVLLILKKLKVFFHFLSVYHSLLVRYKVYSSNSTLVYKDEGMVKSMNTLVLIQHHIERIL